MPSNNPFRKSRDLSPIHAAWAFALFALIVFVIAFTSASRADSLWSANGQPSRSMFADRKAQAQAAGDEADFLRDDRYPSGIGTHETTREEGSQ